MASIVGKKRGGATYYYLVESARVGGKPRITSQEYLGTAEELAAAMRGGGLGLPDRIQHKDFGAVAAAWGVLEDLGVVQVIDEVAGARRADAGASTGTYLALAALNRVVAPCSKLGFAELVGEDGGAPVRQDSPGGAGSPAVLGRDARRHPGGAGRDQPPDRAGGRGILQAGLLVGGAGHDELRDLHRHRQRQGADRPARQGQAETLRPAAGRAGPGGHPGRRDPADLARLPRQPARRHPVPRHDQALRGQYEAITAACGQQPADMTVVFDAGQNSEDNFAFLAGTGLHYIGSVPASDCPDLTALPASARSVVDQERFGGLTGYDTRRVVYGAERRAILTHSPELHESQARGFTGTTLAKAGKKLDELAATLARGKTRRPREKVEAEIDKITAKPWVRRVITWQLSGDQPKDLRLTWQQDPKARAALEDEIFGKHVLITDHDDWPVAEVVAGYRSQSEAEFGFRQLKDPHVVSFSPMFHWTEHNIRVHVFTCVLALQVAHLMRLKARRAGLDLSVRAMLGELAGIGETILLYQSDRGRPRAHRMLTDTTPVQDKLSDIFSLARYAPRR